MGFELPLFAVLVLVSVLLWLPEIVAPFETRTKIGTQMCPIYSSSVLGNLVERGECSSVFYTPGHTE